MAKKDAEQNPQRRGGRARTKKTTPDLNGTIAMADDSRRANDELPNIPEPGDIADQALRSESMGSEPSEEDIRLRAYHRYLERGGGHGRHFDDWLAAERDLKRRS